MKTTTDSDAALFDVTIATGDPGAVIEKVPLEQIELAPNPRRDIDPDGIQQLAVMMSRNGQMIPCIGRRTAKDRVVIYDGQRRKLAAEQSHDLAGTDGHEDLAPIQALTVMLLDAEPTTAEIRRIQRQAQARAEMSQRDKQDQFADCWAERASLPDIDRVAMVCVDLGIKPKEAHNLRRQLTLPDAIRERVAQRPAGGQISVTLANRLADMHRISAQLTDAVARRISSTDLHDSALRDLGAFVTATVRDNDDVYAVRLDDGAALDTADELRRAVKHLDDDRLTDVATVLGVGIAEVPDKLAKMTGDAHGGMLRTVVNAHVRDRAANGSFAWVHERGEDFADAVWLVDPMFMIDLIAQQMRDQEIEQIDDDAGMFSGDDTNDEDMRRARAEEAAEKAKRRDVEREAAARNVGLGADIAATLTDPDADQVAAARDLIVHLVGHAWPTIVAYGGGWTDRNRMKPVGDTGRFEPQTIDEIVDAEITRALQDPDPMRGIMQILSRFGAAFLLDEDGVTKTKDLGRDRMARQLRDALPGGDHPINTALWRFMRPMLSPALIDRHRDRYVTDEQHSTVDLDAQRADRGLSDIEDLLGDDNPDADAA